MRMNGVLKKKPLGRATIDRRQLLIVWPIGKPFEAFSMIALEELVLYSLIAPENCDSHLPINDGDQWAGQRAGCCCASDIDADSLAQILGIPC